MGHDQGRVCHPLTIGSVSRACKSTPPFAHRPRPTGVPRMRATRRPVRPRLTLTPASPSAAEPTGRHPHRSPRPYLVALIGHTRPSSPPLSTKLPPSSPTVRPAPRTRRVVPLPAWGRRPPPSHTGAGPDRMPIKMCRSREPATTAGPERARISAPAPRGGRGSLAPRKGSGTHRPNEIATQPDPPSPVGSQGFEVGGLVGGDVARGCVVCVCVSVKCRLPVRPYLVQ